MKRSKKSKRSKTKYIYTIEKKKNLVNVLVKKKSVCRSDPNCIVTKRSCRKKRNLKKTGLFYGPTLSNIG